MTYNPETDPDPATLMPLYHSGTIGTYALQFAEQWWQETGRDETIASKAIVQCVGNYALSGLVVFRGAPVTAALRENLPESSTDDPGVAFYEVNGTFHPNTARDLGFLGHIARGANRYGRLGPKIAIVQPPSRAD